MKFQFTICLLILIFSCNNECSNNIRNSNWIEFSKINKGIYKSEKQVKFFIENNGVISNTITLKIVINNEVVFLGSIDRFNDSLISLPPMINEGLDFGYLVLICAFDKNTKKEYRWFSDQYFDISENKTNIIDLICTKKDETTTLNIRN
jgi:hypothetical protein